MGGAGGAAAASTGVGTPAAGTGGVGGVVDKGPVIVAGGTAGENGVAAGAPPPAPLKPMILAAVGAARARRGRGDRMLFIQAHNDVIAAGNSTLTRRRG